MSIATLCLSGIALPPLAPTVELPQELCRPLPADGDRPRATPIPREARVRVVVDDNPKKAGTTAHARFALWDTCQTVGEYLTAGGRRAEIAWDLSRGYIELVEPTTE